MEDLLHRQGNVFTLSRAVLRKVSPKLARTPIDEKRRTETRENIH